MTQFMKTTIETGIDIIDLIILVFAMTWPGLIVAKVILRIFAPACAFISYRGRYRRPQDRQVAHTADPTANQSQCHK